MSVAIKVGDCLEVLNSLDAGSVQTCVTSPPYWGLRDYGMPGQLGLEKSPDEYVAKMVAVFGAVRRVLKDDGTLWLNLGDSYVRAGGEQVAQTKWRVEGASATQAQSRHLITGSSDGAVGRGERPGSRAASRGFKAKDLIGIPWRVAFALQADGWYLRSDIIWSKPNPMPESVTDRPTKAHEYVFLLSKSASYFYDAEAVAEPSLNAGRVVSYDGDQKNIEAAKDSMMRTRIAATRTVTDTRNLRSVWSIATQPYSGAHFAKMPPRLAERCKALGRNRGAV